MLSPLKTIRAAMIGLTLMGTAVTAMPAQAQPSVQFDFSIGGGRHWDGPGRPRRPDRFCMRDRDVRQMLRANGFNDIRFTDRRGRVVTVRAERGRRDFRVAVDTCRGRIVGIDRIRRR